MKNLSVVSKIAAIVLACASISTGQSLSGGRAPSFSLPDPTFQQHDLLDYRGRWVLLLFVRTESPASKIAAQVLEARRTKAAILNVGVSPIENQGTITKFIADAKITTTVLFDQGQMAASYFKATPARPSIDLPHLFAINPNGVIAKDWTEAALRDPMLGSQLDALIQSAGTKK